MTTKRGDNYEHLKSAMIHIREAHAELSKVTRPYTVVKRTALAYLEYKGAIQDTARRLGMDKQDVEDILA